MFSHNVSSSASLVFPTGKRRAWQPKLYCIVSNQILLDVKYQLSWVTKWGEGARFAIYEWVSCLVWADLPMRLVLWERVECWSTPRYLWLNSVLDTCKRSDILSTFPIHRRPMPLTTFSHTSFARRTVAAVKLRDLVHCPAGWFGSGGGWSGVEEMP